MKWDLGKLYAGFDAPAFKRDVDAFGAQADAVLEAVRQVLEACQGEDGVLHVGEDHVRTSVKAYPVDYDCGERGLFFFLFRFGGEAEYIPVGGRGIVEMEEYPRCGQECMAYMPAP